jgi:signal transduction histidine kinase
VVSRQAVSDGAGMMVAHGASTGFSMACDSGTPSSESMPGTNDAFAFAGRQATMMASLHLPARRGFSMLPPLRSIATFVFVSAGLVATAAEPEPFRPIGEVLALPLDVAQQEPEVRIRGMVTLRGGPVLSVQDDNDGIFIDTVQAAERRIRNDTAIAPDAIPGAIVEIEGRVTPGGFTHVILPTSVRVVGSGPLPTPRPFDAERFFSGSDVCLVVEATGVVQAAEHRDGRHALTIETDLRTFQALVHPSIIHGDLSRFVDAVVRVTGVQMGLSNTRGETVDPQIFVDREQWFEVVKPVECGPFEVAAVPLESLGRFRREAMYGHRIRTEGTVIHAVPHEAIYLQGAANGVTVQTDFDEPITPGDRVEVSGFIDRGSRVTGLRGALVRRIASGAPPQPLAISADTVAKIVTESIATNIMALPGDYDGCLIRFPATLVERRRGDTEGTLVLSAGATTVLARTDLATFGRLESVLIGSELAVTGIAQATAIRPAAAKRSQPIETIGLLLRSEADVNLIKRPPWWSPRRLVIALGGGLAAVAVAAAGAFSWVALLRRRIASQLGVIEEQLQAEAVAEERRRIAREFHDRLDQGLAGLALRFDAAALQAREETTRSLLLGQRRALSSLQSEARDFLWDLRYPTHLDESFVDSIKQQLLYMRQLTPVPLTVETTGHIPPLSTQVHYHLMRIIREAVGNAIKYAQAQTITVRITGNSGGQKRLGIKVADDGVGFDVADRSTADGHFGIRGMYERARRIGADIRVESGHDRGTLVVIDLPVANS